MIPPIPACPSDCDDDFAFVVLLAKVGADAAARLQNEPDYGCGAAAAALALQARRAAHA